MKTCFIVNPRSGRASQALAAVQAYAQREGATVFLTQRAGHGADLARQALDNGSRCIVAVGGDGTMNEIASVLIGTEGTLGLVPCGSGDGLGRHLLIHGSTERALRIVQTGEPRLIDTGLADGHPFVTVAGLGFEAEIADRFNRLTQRGFWRYLTTSAAAWRRWRPQTYEIRSDEVRATVQAFTLAVANAREYGNHARIAPRARLDDGRLDLCAIPPVSVRNALPLLFRLFRGRLPGSPGVLSLQASRFVVHLPHPGLLHTDGEVHAVAGPVEFQVRPASLRIRVPRAGD